MEHTVRVLLCSLFVHALLFPILGTVSRTQEWRIQRKQRLKAAATAGLDVDNLPPPPRKRQKQHKTHKCSKFHKTLNGE